MASYIMFPERVNSIEGLERLQRILGRELPIVLYPSNPEEESGTDRRFSEKLFQPTPEVMYNWGVKTVEELIGEANKRGYSGFCLDLFHIRGEDIEGVGLNPWQETLPQLLPHTKEIHISAGRGDIRQKRIDTKQELEDLLKGKGDSELLDIIRLIRESKWTGQVVTEIPAVSLHNIRTKRGLFASVKDLIHDHRKIVGNIQDMLS